MPKSSAEPEREQTDQSLAGERARTDAALLEKAAIEQSAEAVIEQARDRADQVLAKARDVADAKLDTATRREETESAILKERNTEDRLIGELRAKADETLHNEREASARVLARLIPVERERTDQSLQTERARFDDALSYRDDFLGMVSHDLRDLLNGIQLGAHQIAETAASDENGRSLLLQIRRIQRSAARMNRLVGDLVDVASIDAGKLGICADEYDAFATVREAVETWTDFANKKGIELRASAEGRLLARFDQERVLQVLGNLITNAVKFSRVGGTVSVGVERAGSQVRFFVEDSGVGISKDNLDRVFDRFWQMGKQDRRGLGLGLYISRCLVDAHGGAIWVESELGVGSTFFFTMPAQE